MVGSAFFLMSLYVTRSGFLSFFTAYIGDNGLRRIRANMEDTTVTRHGIIIEGRQGIQVGQCSTVQISEKLSFVSFAAIKV